MLAFSSVLANDVIHCVFWELEYELTLLLLKYIKLIAEILSSICVNDLLFLYTVAF